MNTASAKRILVVDDEPDVTELLDYHLKKAGYVPEVINDPLLIMARAREFQPDLFLLDIMMPELDGMKICRMLRADPALKAVPIIFLTACADAEDRVRGLEIGADDYVSKPFNIKELVIRVGLVLRRSGGADAEAMSAGALLRAGPIVLDPEEHTVLVDGKSVELTATEFRLLKLLMERPGRVQTRENLLVNVWNYETDTETRTIDTHVRRLREKLGQAAALIRTVRGVGYRIR